MLGEKERVLLEIFRRLVFSGFDMGVQLGFPYQISSSIAIKEPGNLSSFLC